MDRKLGVVRQFIVCLVYMNCCIESLIVEVNVKLCDLLPITDSLGAKSRVTSDQDDKIA